MRKRMLGRGDGGWRGKQFGREVPARDPAGVVGLFVGGVGRFKGEERAFFEHEELGAGLAADKERGEGGQMRLVAHDRDIAAVLRLKVEAFGDLAGIVFRQESGNLDAQRVHEEEPGGERVGGLAGAKERAVPDLDGAKDAACAQEAGESGDLGETARTQRTRRILLFREGVGVAHEVEKHGPERLRAET
jgi:hypothetical protein